VGTWKDALTALLLPLDRQGSYLLAGRAETPDSLLLQEGARPNDRAGRALLPGINETNEVTNAEFAEEKNGVAVYDAPAPASPKAEEEKPVEVAIEATAPPVPEVKEEKPAEAASPRIDTPAPFAIRWGMPQKLTWKDTDEIAYALIDAHPDQDPLKLSFPKLHKMVLDLEDFGDEPDKSSESVLESIQMAWYEEVK
jgi:FeS assembly protein IscX